MSVFFAGGEMEAYTASSANVIESNSAGTFDTSCARCSIRVGAGTTTDYAQSPVYTSATTSWTHWEWYQFSSSGSSGTTMATWYNSGGTAVFRIQFTGTFTIQAQYWNGSAWTNIGSTTVLLSSTRYVFDLKIICGGSGSFELFMGNASTLSGSASMTSVTNIAQHRLQCSTTTAAANNSCFSQIICADVSTVGWKYFLKPPTGNSATNTQWSGGFGDIDELVLSTADFVGSTTNNDVSTYTGAALTLGSGAVKAVTVSAQAKNIATGPQNLQLALRRSSTNYFTSNVTGIGTGYLPFVAVWETDPSTGSAWTTTNAAAAATEFGQKSIA